MKYRESKGDTRQEALKKTREYRMVNNAVKATRPEDAEDLAAFSRRKSEKSLSFDTFVRGLKLRARIWALGSKPRKLWKPS